VVRGAAAELLGRYGGWLAAVDAAAAEATVAVLFASAYGNTGAMAQALCRGVTRAGAAAELLNVEFADAAEVQAALGRAGGFALGSPTLGGHMPTPVRQCLGAILQLPEARQLPCGVFGSFGWSGEAVDELEARLRDGGFAPAFAPLRCKFAPTAATLQQCEEAGTDIAQAVLREARRRRARRQRDAAQEAAASSAAGADGAASALGRVVGSLCVLSARSGDAASGMLASWVSQASFEPPAITVAVAKDRAVESLVLAGAPFVLNVLAAGRERAAQRAMLRPFEPGADRFAGLATREAPGCRAPVLADAAAYLECRVSARMDAGCARDTAASGGARVSCRRTVTTGCCWPRWRLASCRRRTRSRRCTTARADARTERFSETAPIEQNKALNG
jgi:flavin reductase (DIM6/NTAB) family NADH-FMN oxidoreductase RutF